MTETLKNTDKEKIVIGNCLNDDACVKTAIGMGLTSKAFSDNLCQATFETMEKMIRECVKIDMMTVDARLKGYLDFLMDCSNLAASYNVLFDENVSDLIKLAAVREACGKMDKIKAEMQEDPLKTDAYIKKIEAMSKRFSQSVSGHGVADAEDGLKAYVDMITSNVTYQNIPLLRGLKASIFHRGETFVLAADTGAGKTAFAAGAVNLMLDQGLSVLYCCCESSKAEIMGRIVSARCDVDHKKFIKRSASRNELEAHNAAIQQLRKYKSKLFLHCLGDKVKMTPSGVMASAKQLVETAGQVDVIIIDFLQRFHADYVKAGTNKTAETEEVIQGLHDIFMELGAAGLVLCQYHRGGQQAARESSEPQLNWLRDCGEIENLAHAVVHIVVKQEKGQEKTFELVCNQKARNVEPFRISMRRTGSTFEVDTTKYASDNDIPSEF